MAHGRIVIDAHEEIRFAPVGHGRELLDRLGVCQPEELHVVA